MRLLLIILTLTTIISASPVFTVLYFDNDNKSGSQSINKGLAEILATEIRSRTDAVLVERENLNKIIREQELALSGMIADSLVPKVGEILGTTHLITGTYMLSGESIIISVKILNVESGTIDGAARAMGSTNKFATLTSELIKSTLDALAKMGVKINSPVKRNKHNEEFDITAILSYGEALHAYDSGNKKQAESSLKELSSSISSFSYANLSLNRIRSNLEKSKEEQQKYLEKTSQQSSYDYMTFMKVCNTYMQKMQFRELFKVCQKARKKPFEIPGGMVQGLEIIDYYAITAAQALKAWDVVAEIGDAFLKDFPQSMYLTSVQSAVKTALYNLEKTNETKTNLHPQIATLNKKLKSAKSENEKTNIFYQIGKIYYDNNLLRDAADQFYNIDIKIIGNDEKLFFMLSTFYNIMDTDKALKLRDQLTKEFPSSEFTETANSMLSYLDTVR